MTGILLRLDIQDEQKIKIFDFINKRIGTEYDKKGSVLSLLRRLASKINPFSQTEELTEEELEKLATPMFCSNVFAHAYRYAGVKINFPYNDKFVWPKDFVLNPNFQKICRFKIT